MFVIDIPSLHVDDLKQQPDTGPPIKAVPGTAAQPPTSMCCWWGLLKEHHPTAPPPQHHFTTDQCLSEYISSSSPKSSLMDFLQLYFLFSILNCSRGSLSDWWWVGHLSLSLSLSLSLTHTHKVNFFSSYEWMNEARESVIHFSSSQSEEY
jgi:hypothetical protein